MRINKQYFGNFPLEQSLLYLEVTNSIKPEPDNNIGSNDTKPLHRENDRYLSTTKSPIED